MSKRLEDAYSQYFKEFRELEAINTGMHGVVFLKKVDPDMAAALTAEFVSAAWRVKYAQKYLMKLMREEMAKGAK